MTKSGLTSAEQFVLYAIEIGALELVPEGRALKSGRISPYFFNSGLFNDGESLGVLANAYASTIFERFTDDVMEPTFNILYGPPYKGTILAPAISLCLSMFETFDTSFCTSRKEAKEHGEKGTLIGAPILAGSRVLLIDDVITDGGTKREAVEFIRGYGGELGGLVIAFDRQERSGDGKFSAAQEFEFEYGVPVCAVATFTDLISVLQKMPSASGDPDGVMFDKIKAYCSQYGV